MQIALYSQYFRAGDAPHIQHLFSTLEELAISIVVYKPWAEEASRHLSLPLQNGTFETHQDFAASCCDFLITLGGDGTILSALSIVRHTQIPILGINLGRFGFLATVNKNRIREALILLKEQRYHLSRRHILQLDASPQLFGDMPYALNDFTLLKRDTSAMITIHAYVDGVFLNTYWADGIIMATPTGSTGYSLSCGGPIIFPDSGNFVLTPVAPHNLNMRPLVLSDRSVISFEVEGRSDSFLCTLDSRHEVITTDYRLTLRRGDFCVHLIELHDGGFPATIRNKLAWGIDLRNR